MRNSPARRLQEKLHTTVDVCPRIACPAIGSSNTFHGHVSQTGRLLVRDSVTAYEVGTRVHGRSQFHVFQSKIHLLRPVARRVARGVSRLPAVWMLRIVLRRTANIAGAGAVGAFELRKSYNIRTKRENHTIFAGVEDFPLLTTKRFSDPFLTPPATRRHEGVPTGRET
jgi:hypothetical protein